MTRSMAAAHRHRTGRQHRVAPPTAQPALPQPSTNRHQRHTAGSSAPAPRRAPARGCAASCPASAAPPWCPGRAQTCPPGCTACSCRPADPCPAGGEQSRREAEQAGGVQLQGPAAGARCRGMLQGPAAGACSRAMLQGHAAGCQAVVTALLQRTGADHRRRARGRQQRAPGTCLWVWRTRCAAACCGCPSGTSASSQLCSNR